MRAICWHCGEAVTYPAFAKSKEVLCPDCGEAVFMPLERARVLLEALAAALGTAAVWLAEVWDLPLWGGLLLLASVPLGQRLLWPLVRRGPAPCGPGTMTLPARPGAGTTCPAGAAAGR